MSNLAITLLESDPKTADELATRCLRIPSIDIRKVDRVLYTKPPSDMDAVFLVLPAAEKWGAVPIPGKAQVLRTTPEDQARGLPRYVVTGVALRPTDPRGPLPETKMLLATAVEAIRHFNAANPDNAIRTVGFWAVNLLKGVTAEQLSNILADVVSGQKV
jgi:hypothetical protein